MRLLPLATLLLVRAILASPLTRHPLPLIIWHGLGDNYAAEGLHTVGDLANETNPGTTVYYIRLDESPDSDKTATFLGNVTAQLETVCADLTSHPMLSAAPAVNALGFSQGGQFLRGLVQRCGALKVRNLVTFGSQHNGIAEYQDCSDAGWVCRAYSGLLRANTWGAWAQAHLVPAQYFRATDEETGAPTQDYLSHSNFLADVNNERVVKNKVYKERLAALKRFVMFVFEEDTTVVPKESGWFAEVNATSGDVTPLRERAIYKEDWIGLRALDERGALEFRSTEGGHMRLTDEVLTDVFERYFSVGDASWEGYHTPRGDGDGEEQMEL